MRFHPYQTQLTTPKLTVFYFGCCFEFVHFDP
jgi:hypothetical protein